MISKMPRHLLGTDLPSYDAVANHRLESWYLTWVTSGSVSIDMHKLQTTARLGQHISVAM